MSIHIRKGIEKIKALFLEIGTMVEENTARAVRALEERDRELAGKTIEFDLEIDEMEVNVEEECLKVLALHQPVAVDLRFIVAVLKINNDLERIGDLAVNIAERAEALADKPQVDLPMDFDKMAEVAQWMLRKGLDALVNLDMELARDVCCRDDEVDEMNKEMYEQVKAGIKKEPEYMEQLIHLLCVSRHIERIGDHATNIAEDVLYMGEGEIIRHKHECYSGE